MGRQYSIIVAKHAPTRSASVAFKCQDPLSSQEDRGGLSSCDGMKWAERKRKRNQKRKSVQKQTFTEEPLYRYVYSSNFIYFYFIFLFVYYIPLQERRPPSLLAKREGFDKLSIVTG
jgi:hypothetical protein